MDFETSEWNVPSDADGLTTSLFGKLHNHKIKKKSKIQDSHVIHLKQCMLKKEQKMNVDDQYKIVIMSKLERKKLKMQRRKLKKLKHRDQGFPASKGDNNDCRMCGYDREVDNLKCISTCTKDNGLPSMKRKRNELDFAMEDNDISILPRKKARIYLNSGPIPVDIKRSKSDKRFEDRNENENLKRNKQSEDHTVDIKDNSEKKKKKNRRRSKKNKFKVESPVKKDEHLGSITSEEEFSTNMKKTTNQSLSGIIKKQSDVDMEDKARKKKKRRKSQKNNCKVDSDQKNDKQISSSTSVRELQSDMKESNIKCLTASILNQNEVNPRINKNEASQKQTIFSNKPLKPHKNSPFNVEKLNNILDDKQSVTNAIEGKFSDKGSSIKEQKQLKNDSPKSASLKEKMLERLSAARFRYLNEQLYTTTGDKAFQMFQEDADSFALYHTGFQGQVEKWPNNPVDLIIRFIISRPKHLIIADFGCGDAKIARSVPNKVYSFDLAALNEHVTVCNMARVPLTDSSVDIAVFCLSLMGTNLADYLREAHRVLKNGGILKIAEVKSRFQNLGAFVKRVKMLGFKLTNQDAENKMFIMIDFKKSKPAKSSGLNIKLTLYPCVYKKR
ncbi:hypothetical protein CHS0354_012569 [Potamilus streckersoni]|uniref:Ribosomal RNA-processing protein 8 n=1 Tax=Potamilus streckersoni TaxID=2493646 RepID=A0AAE0SXX3_9BIVA|nr:hypothetical protein CHS0354_012569 [Potamilus streckersoni]